MEASLQKARQLYDTFQYERALEELQGVRQHVRTEDELVSLLLYKGIFLAELLRKEEASAAFAEALRLRPGASLPENISPKITLQFEATRAALAVSKPEPPKRPAEPGPQSKARPPSPKQPTKPPSPIDPPTPSPGAPEYVEETTEPPPKEMHPPLSMDAAPSPQVAEVPKGRAFGPRVLVPAATGGALVMAGSVFWGLAWREHSRLASADLYFNNISEMKASASRFRTYQTVGFSLLGAGIVGLGVATSLYGLSERGSSVVLGVGTNGTQVFLHGRWL